VSTARSALVLVAHADDETLGCGGTIPRLLAEGWSVEVVILSDGLITTRGDEVQDQRDDAARASAVLGLDPPRFMGFPDQRFDQVAVADMAGAVSALGHDPDLILTTSAADLNGDHRLACEVAKIVGRPRRRPVSILACEVPASASWAGAPFPASFYVDVTATIGLKLEAFACYRGEVEAAPGPWSLEGIEVLSRYHGIQSGLAHAEAFQVIRAVAGQLP
jgi:LmbE family N-acetylglucosaminyl deacetylase